MKIDALKLTYTADLLQAIVFDRQGAMAFSCDSLTDTKEWIGENLYEKFPMLGSLQPAIANLAANEHPISLPAVDMLLGSRKGVFDFDIFPHPQQDGLMVWMIVDNTKVYTYLQEIQQERNVLRMELEDLKNGRSIQRR